MYKHARYIINIKIIKIINIQLKDWSTQLQLVRLERKRLASTDHLERNNDLYQFTNRINQLL